ncbi:MAG TPA: DegT/DnrJ/EryC1/StrS aminotransferase family protein [Gemmatimonadales bacterium]|nr:DegT/DnrJ/EryC1/StrS aminotransferase family protein [Gemmatimonadales bacterium]
MTITQPLDRPERAPRDRFLTFAPPCIGEEEIAEVVDTLRSGWITTGPKTARFEQEFARYLGAPGALALNSCTAGLHVALVTLGIGPGDEVITTPLTFAASANVIEHVRARPVFADVDPVTLQMDPAQVEAAVTPRTRAIIVVHFGGHPANLSALRDIAARHRLAIIEDAAHALPARHDGQLIGSGDNPVAFSFYATKNLTTGEGGMLTADPDFLARARVVSLHGMSHDGWYRYAEGGHWYYEVKLPGFKYNMTDIQAALGLWQLRKLEQHQRRRRAVAAAYHAAFAGCDAFELPTEQPGVEHAWHLYVLRLQPGALTIGRDQFVAELTRRRIGTSVHFIPLHLHPYYRDTYGYAPDAYPVAYANYQRMLSLPLHPGLTDADVTDVTEAVLDIARTHQR